MKSRKIKTEISEKLKNVCEELSEKERKGVLVGMLVTSTVLCGITVARAFGRFLSHGTQKELPFVHPVDSLHRADKDSIMYHPKTNENYLVQIWKSPKRQKKRRYSRKTAEP